VVPLYCFDPRQFIATPWGNPKTGAYRAQFLIESVLDLKQGLRQLGSDLMVHMGPPEEALQGDAYMQRSAYLLSRQPSSHWLMHYSNALATSLCFLMQCNISPMLPHVQAMQLLA
jgi:deoxyribodipyrimidine photolyase